MAYPTVTVYKTASGILNRLALSHGHWKGARFGEIAFRGQGDASWRLTPAAFRPGTMLGFEKPQRRAPVRRIHDQSWNEYRSVRTFVDLADSVGLALPGDLHSFRSLEDRILANSDGFWRDDWPRPGDLEILAIAQHHGVPTRLLDFTYNPYVALYFAAKSAAWLLQSDRNPKPQRFAVWAVDLRFTRAIWARTPRYPERIREVVVARAGNDFLRAQQGFFLTDIAANRFWRDGSPPNLDDVIRERINYWEHKPGAWPNGIPSQNWPLFVKLEIDVDVVSDVVRSLRDQNFHEASIMPSLDHVVGALESLGRP